MDYTDKKQKAKRRVYEQWNVKCMDNKSTTKSEKEKNSK